MTLPLLVLAVPSVLAGLWGAPQLGNGFGALPGRAGVSGRGDGCRDGGDRDGAGAARHRAGVRDVLGRVISPVAMAARFRPIYVTLFNRYWIDELYCWLMDRLIIAVAFFLGMFDRK